MIVIVLFKEMGYIYIQGSELVFVELQDKSESTAKSSEGILGQIKPNTTSVTRTHTQPCNIHIRWPVIGAACQTVLQIYDGLPSCSLRI